MYAISIGTSVLFIDIVGNWLSATITGFGAPIAYCFLLAIVIKFRSGRTLSSSPSMSKPTVEQRKVVSPVIIAAIIQALATVIVANIATIN